MISPIDICNQALAHLGDRRIHRIDEDAQETDAIVRYCAEYYEQTKQEVLAAHRWTFAKKAVALTRSVGDAIFKYNYSHVLPTDMMRFLEILEAEVVGEEDDAVEGVASMVNISMSTQPSDGDTLTIGSRTYTFQSTLQNMDGNIWTGANAAAAQANLGYAIKASGGVPGVDYAALMTANTEVTLGDIPVPWAPNTFTAIVTGVAGDSLVSTETFTAAFNQFATPTLTGGVDAVEATKIYAYNRKIDKFKIVGNKVWSNVEELGLFYIYNIDDPDQWTAHFRACVARKLAHYLAGPVADNPDEARRQLDLYERIDLPNAQFYDAVQDSSNENSDMETRVARSPLLSARYREGYTLGNSSDEPITYP